MLALSIRVDTGGGSDRGRTRPGNPFGRTPVETAVWRILSRLLPEGATMASSLPGISLETERCIMREFSR